MFESCRCASCRACPDESGVHAACFCPSRPHSAASGDRAPRPLQARRALPSTLWPSVRCLIPPPYSATAWRWIMSTVLSRVSIPVASTSLGWWWAWLVWPWAIPRSRSAAPASTLAWAPPWQLLACASGVPAHRRIPLQLPSAKRGERGNCRSESRAHVGS